VLEFKVSFFNFTNLDWKMVCARHETRCGNAWFQEDEVLRRTRPSKLRLLLEITIRVKLFINQSAFLHIPSIAIRHYRAATFLIKMRVRVLLSLLLLSSLVLFSAGEFVYAQFVWMQSVVGKQQFVPHIIHTRRFPFSWASRLPGTQLCRFVKLLLMSSVRNTWTGSCSVA
jgi:hypothetical protein